MAKDTNSSKCPEVASASKKTFASVRTDKFICNDGFILKFSVVMTGTPLCKEEITSIGRSCCYTIGKLIEEYRSDPDDGGQLYLEF